MNLGLGRPQVAVMQARLAPHVPPGIALPQPDPRQLGIVAGDIGVHPHDLRHVVRSQMDLQPGAVPALSGGRTRRQRPICPGAPSPRRKLLHNLRRGREAAAATY